MESRFGECPELQNFLSLSCLCLEGADYPACFKTWDTLWAYRPSVVVEHNSLGLGTLASNDGERLLINFEKKPGHSMTLAFAQKSLTVLAPGHLKAQIALDRNGVMDRFKEDPASIVVAILGDLGGSAKGADVKKYLVYVGLPVTAFAAWWKKAKAAAEKHPRLDTHEAYRDVMHLLKEGADGIGRSMPVLEVKKGPKSAWPLLKRFLSQHPTALDEARRRYRPYFEGWAMMPEINTMERAAAVMVLARWFPDLKQFWTPMARELDLAVLDVPNWSSELDQELWFELLAGSEDWSEVLPLFLGSKRPQVRARARRELSARWGDREAQELRKLLERAGEIPAVAVALCTEALNSDPLPPWAEPWRLAMAIISVLGGKAPETVHQECLRAIDPNEGRLVTLVQSKPGESLASSLGSLLRHWRTSDSFLFQVFAFLNKTPATDLVTDAEAFRTEALRRLEIPTGDQAENDSILMSRSTFDRMVYDLERMDRELKTSIPDAIRKARELGDLRENAEYDAAKLKQRQTTERCEQLQKAITSVRIIEDLPISEEKAGPGTEVEMQSATGPRSVWIMGEGDNHLGENVTSYRAALGKILSGVKVGEKVTLKEDSGEVEYTVKKIRKRLPEGATA